MISSGWYCHGHRARFVGAVADGGETLPCGCRAEVETVLWFHSGGKDGRPWEQFTLSVHAGGRRWVVVHLSTDPGETLEAAIRRHAERDGWVEGRLQFVLAAAEKAPGRGWTDMQWRDHMAREATHGRGADGQGASATGA